MKRAFAGLSLAAALAACGGGPTFAAAELDRVMPGAGDAPAGTEFREDQSGAIGLREFVRDESVQTKLRSLGFRAAHAVTFATQNLPTDLTLAQPGSALYAGFAVALADERRANEGFAFYSERMQSRAKDFTPVLTPKIGEQSIAFRFSRLEDAPLPGVAFLWRYGNTLFGVVGVGNPDPKPEAVRRLAARIDERSRE